jgi:hypothetical protein
MTSVDFGAIAKLIKCLGKCVVNRIFVHEILLCRGPELYRLPRLLSPTSEALGVRADAKGGIAVDASPVDNRKD